VRRCCIARPDADVIYPERSGHGAVGGSERGCEETLANMGAEVYGVVSPLIPHLIGLQDQQQRFLRLRSNEDLQEVIGLQHPST